METRERYGITRREQSGQPQRGYDILPSPYGVIRRLADEVNQLFNVNEFGSVGSFGFTPGLGSTSGVTSGFAVPAIDLCETNDAYVVEVELPGVDPENVDVQTTGDSLTVRAQTRRADEKQDQGYHVTERRFGTFIREIALPGNISPDKTRARFNNGLLEITLPKTEQTKGQRIAVTSGQQQTAGAKGGEMKGHAAQGQQAPLAGRDQTTRSQK